MTISLIAVGAIVAIFIAVKVVLRLIARCERKRFDSMMLDEQRRYQEGMYKKQQVG